MTEGEFIDMLRNVCSTLTHEARTSGFDSARAFESRVRDLVHNASAAYGENVELAPPAQSFPDIVVGEFGIEVKFTSNDTWRSVANSVLESNRAPQVVKIFLIFGKLGGIPEVRYAEYASCVMHVRTSHVPRFEVEIEPLPPRSLFELMNTTYDTFRILPMEQKMQHIRQYARGRLKDGERLWWLDDSLDRADHTLPIQARLYTKLSKEEKSRLRAEATLVCPSIVDSGRSKAKYDDAVLYLLTYHGVLCHQARDLFSAGSIANPNNDKKGGLYIQRALELLQDEIAAAAERLPASIFEEYWGHPVPVKDRLAVWLQKADLAAKKWVPSQHLFLEYQRMRQDASKSSGACA